MSGKKLNVEEIIDLSDYARDIAVLMVKPFVKTSLRAWHITVFHFALSVLLAYYVYLNTPSSLAFASVLLAIKNILDASDGSLARLQKRPSKIGRFLDSNCDFLGHLLLFFAIRESPVYLKVLGFLSFVLQGSFYNYYFVLFRHLKGGEKTSKLKENGENEYPYDNAAVVKALYFVYVVFYQWQDNIVHFTETKILKCREREPSLNFLRALSLFAPGFQYLFIIMFLTGGIPSFIPLFFLLPYNGLLIGVLYLRKRQCAAEDSK